MLVLAAGLAFAAPAFAADNPADATPAAERESASPSAVNTKPATATLPDEALSDPAITERVRSKLERDPRLAGSRITVSTSAGVVSLTGRVRSQEQLAVAEAQASDDGVMRVDDNLAIRPR